MEKNLFIKRISIIIFTLTLLVYTIAIVTEPAQGYERSLYAMYPPIFWIFILTTIILSVTVIILSEYWKIQGFWKIALISMLIVYSIILLLPLVRGYYMVNWGDTPAHLSWAQHILNTGELNTYYPLIHIQLVTLYFSGITLETAAMITPVIYFALYIVSLSVLGKTLQRGVWVSLLPILFALPPIFGAKAGAIGPQGSALCLFPLFYYLIFSAYTNPQSRGQRLILLLIVSLFLTFLHPLSTLILMTLLVGFIVTIGINCPKKYNHLTNFVLQCLVITSMAFSFWYLLCTESLLKPITRVIDALFVSESATIAEKQLDIIAQSDVSIYRFIEVFIKHYGAQSIYLSIGLLCILWIIFNIKMKRSSRLEVLFLSQYLIAAMWSVALVFGSFIVSGFMRALSQLLVITTILIPIVIYKNINDLFLFNIKKYFFVVIALSIIIASSLSVFTMFPSPWSYAQNDHFTYHDKSGYDWFLNYKDDRFTTIETEGTYTYFKYELYYVERSRGENNYVARKYVDNYRQFLPLRTVYHEHLHLTEALPPEQFYYLSNEYNLPRKITTSGSQEEQPQSIHIEQFSRLKQDNSINLIYSNGEFESWWIPVKIW